MAAAHFLPETSPPVQMTSHIAAAKVGAEEDWPHKTSNQDDNALASLTQKTSEDPMRVFVFAIASVGVFFWRSRQEKQARRELTTLFQMKPVQGRSEPLDLKWCQPTLIDRLPEEDPSQERVSGEEETEMSLV